MNPGTDRRPERGAAHNSLNILEWTSVAVLGGLVVALTLAITGSHWILNGPIPLVGAGCALVLAAVKAVLLPYSLRARPASTSPVGRLSKKPLDYLSALLNVSRAIGSGNSGSELDQIIVDSCRDCFDCDEASIMTLDREELKVTAFAGHRDINLVRNARVRLGQGVAGSVAVNRTPLILGPQVDSKRFSGFQEKKRRIASAMIAPIVVRTRVVGVLSASTGSEEKTFSEDDLRVFCILAEHAGIVAAKARDAERVARLLRRMRRRSRKQRQAPRTAEPGASSDLESAA